jgi:hypothetical protein
MIARSISRAICARHDVSEEYAAAGQNDQHKQDDRQALPHSEVISALNGW